MSERAGEVMRYLSSFLGVGMPALGAGTEGVLGWLQGVATGIGVNPESVNSLGEIELLMFLIEAKGGKRDDSFHRDNLKATVDGLLRLARLIDRRVNVMEAIWTRLGKERLLPLDHGVFLRDIYYSGIIADPLQDISDAEVSSSIIRVIDPEGVPEDEQYINERGEPTEFLYTEILASVDKGLDGEDTEPPPEEDDDDDTDEIDATPVDSAVNKFLVYMLREHVKRGMLDLDPPWQRTDLWSPKKKKELIKSLLLGIPLPSMILHKRGDSFSIIDGKQRLSAIMQFMDNRFKLPNYDVPDDHDLYKYRGCWFDKKGKRNIDESGKNKIELTEIPVIIFNKVEERRLRRIFSLYNVNATKLNSAEIRNAAYQNNPIHRVSFSLAGERKFEDPPDLDTGDYEAQKRFTDRLRKVLPSTKRYAALDFICRYLGYSRAVKAVRPKGGGASPERYFKPISTTAIVNRFFDRQSRHEVASDVAKEIIRVFEATGLLFDIDDDRHAFFRRDEKGRMRFNALVAITNMVATRLLLDCLGKRAFEPEVRDAIETVTAGVAYPDNQQSATIWDYQAKVVLGLVKALNLDGETMAGGKYSEFLQNMSSVAISD